MMNKQKIFAIATATLLGALSINSMAAVPNVFSPSTPARASEVNANFSSLDARSAAIEARLDALEANSPTTDKADVAVDCDATQDFFTNAFTGAANVRYTISGQCDGPVIIRHDDVEFVGADGAASIVLPTGADLSMSEAAAVFVDGAARVDISNLTIDSSAFNDETSGSSTLFVAQGGFVRATDLTSIGGQFGILSYRNAYLQLGGSTSIQSFVNSGLTVGDDSGVLAFGPVNIFTTNESGGYIDAIETFSNGFIALRDNVDVAIPAATEAVPFRNAVFSGTHSSLGINQGNTIDLSGNVTVNRNSYLILGGATVDGDIRVFDNGILELQNVTQTTVSGSEGNTEIDSSRARFDNTQLAGDLLAITNSTVRMFGGTIGGAVGINSASKAEFSDVNESGTPGDLDSDGGDIDATNSKFNNVSITNGARLNSAESEFAGVFGSSDSTLLFFTSTITGGIGMDDGSFLRLSGTTYAPASDELFMFNSKALFEDSIISSRVSLEDASSVRIVNSTLNEFLSVSTGSFARLINVVQNGVDSNIAVNNGRLHIDESQVGRLDAFLDATIVLAKSEFAGFSANAGSNIQVFGGTVSGDVGIFGASAVNMDVDENGAGTLNGSTVYLCGLGDSSFIAGFDPAGADTGYAATGTVEEFACLP